MKKKLLLLTGIVLATGMLGACSSQQAAETTEESSGTAQAESNTAASEESAASDTWEADDAAEGDPVEVVWWNNEVGQWTFWEGLVNEFNSTVGKEQNIVIRMEQPPENVDYEIAVDNGTAPDIGWFDVQKGAEKGQVCALEDLPDMEEFLEENASLKMEGGNAYEGKTYASWYSTTAYGLAYNKDMFKAAGLVDENGEATPPKTWDEVREYAKILTDESKQQYGIAMPLKWSGWFQCEVQRTLNTINGYGIFNYATGEYDFSDLQIVIDAYMGMKEDGSVYPGAEGLDNDPARARFAEGNIGMKFCAHWDVAVWNDQFPAKCDWGIAPLPSADGEQKYYSYMEPGRMGRVNANSVAEKGEAISVVYRYLFGTESQIKAYEQGVYFPYRTDIYDMASAPENRKGFEDMAEVIKLCKYPGQMYSTELPPDFEGLQADFLANVWSGQMSSADWTQKITDLYNEAVKTYQENNPDKDESDRLHPIEELEIQ